jgi:hypothetical protein
MLAGAVTEVVPPWELSAMSIFRTINQEALAALNHLRACKARWSRGNPVAETEFVEGVAGVGKDVVWRLCRV